ncbi:MAG: ABC transporter periplasmic component protein [Candidatus Tokpelaia hoelldobleri]|uniref:ABC transporter periplasmic component protein n=1 Tax=Candidatus Tokpelaia hoelldobleri TaxID=1902579 RepID=A0A1U9JSY9_9HYPH|nr:MAG: ABC transporter periplasmic component protein [Candidatus Tokpelaia hoelldoblerii]
MRGIFAAIVAGGVLCTASGAFAQEPEWQSIATLGSLSRYAGHFARYDYVNPQAPRGGTLDMVVQGTFDSFNPYIPAGQAPSPGFASFGGGLIYSTLMDQSQDEAGVFHASLAQAMQTPADHSWARFRLNEKARWHDGQPVTPEDVVWSFEVLRKISPMYNSYYSGVERAAVTGVHEVAFFFKRAGNRELPYIMGDLPVLPKHWWEGRDAQGKKRDITRPALEIPLGSGPYRLTDFETGKYAVWQRVKDFWGADLPQNIGRYNYDRIRYTYLTGDKAVWEAFKKGGIYDYRQENRITNWMMAYNFPAVHEGRVKQVQFAPYSGYFQAYFFNTRRAKFADVRVRKALTLALDFESMNRLLYFSQYQRIRNYYNTPYTASQGLPAGREREILETVRDLVPEAVFTQEFHLPEYKTLQDSGRYLGQAMQLLREAGFHLEKNGLVDGHGNPFTIEFLFPAQSGLEKAASFYVGHLQRLGIQAFIRTVDNSQYQYRLNHFDYDIVFDVMAQSVSPGNEQMGYFGSAAADIAGSRNLAGVKNKSIDRLIEHLLHAQDYDELAATTRALDRVLLWNYYTVPAWGAQHNNLAYWDKLRMPPRQPAHASYDPMSWWIEP